MGERYEVEVLRLGAGGDAVTRRRDSQMVVFVPHAAPGDKLLIEETESQPRFKKARIVELLEAGPGRIEAPCPVHFRPQGASAWCGGCDWQHLSSALQLDAKRSIVTESLERIGRVRAEVAPTIASPEAWRYRNKVQIPFQKSEAGVVFGFYHPGTHRIVPFEDCLVQPELSVRIARFVRDMAARREWPAYDEDTRRGWLRHLFVRTSRDGKAIVAFVTKTEEFRDVEAVVKELRDAFPELIGIHQNVQPQSTNVVVGPRWNRLWGKGRLREQVGPLTLAVSPQAFLQVNTRASEVLYETAKACLSEGGFRPKLLWDLYCGIGSIALYLSGAADHVTGIESNGRAVADADLNADLNRIENVRFVHGRAEDVVRRAEVRMEPPWAAVLDPPRAGCDQAVIEFLSRKEFQRIVYVSCDPTSFARDVGRLAKAGWTLGPVQPVDLFPQTSHVELVARLDRTSLPEAAPEPRLARRQGLDPAPRPPKRPPRKRFHGGGPPRRSRGGRR